MTALLCPRCSVDLRDVRGVSVCASCGGAFFAAAATTAIAAKVGAVAAIAAIDDAGAAVADDAAALASRRVDTEAPAPCPVCRAVMERACVGTVDVDTCGAHGTWFDRGELRLVRVHLSRAARSPHAPQPFQRPKTASSDASHGRARGTTSLPDPGPPRPLGSSPSKEESALEFILDFIDELT